MPDISHLHGSIEALTSHFCQRFALFTLIIVGTIASAQNGATMVTSYEQNAPQLLPVQQQFGSSLDFLMLIKIIPVCGTKVT